MIYWVLCSVFGSRQMFYERILLSFFHNYSMSELVQYSKSQGRSHQAIEKSWPGMNLHKTNASFWKKIYLGSFQKYFS